MKKTLLLLFLTVASFSFAQEVQETHQRAKVFYSQPEDLQRLHNLGIAVDHGINKRNTFIISEFSVSELDKVRAAGYQVEVLIEDARAYFLDQNRRNLPAQRNTTCDGASDDYTTPANFTLGSMGGYLTYQEALDQLDLMRSLYPNLITAKADISNFVTNGTPDNSVTPSIGGNGIKWVRISDNPDVNENEAEILYTSIHHAREPISLSQLIFYMWYLLENYDSDPVVQSIVDNTELYFVPVVNPDGYLYNEKTDPNGGGFWRKNRFNTHGVDNNRNYDYHINGDPNNGSWSGPGSSSNTNSDIYHGSAPFSEVENQAIKWFVENHDFVIAHNNHTFGRLLYYPFAYDDVATPDDPLYQAIGAELTSRNGYTALRDFPFSGDSDDFMYGTVGTHDKIFAFTPEVGNEFWPPSNQIETLCKEMMYLNLTSAQMINNFATVTDTVGDQGAVNATFDIRRLGIVGDGTFTVSINPVSANITSAGNSVTFTNMDLLETDNGTIQYTLGGTVNAGDDIVYDLVVNNGMFDNATRITKKFGALTEVFNDPGNSTSTNFNNNGWGTTSSVFVSPSSSITDSPSGNYPNNTNETITLDTPIDLTDAVGANVTFYAQWEIENNWDYVQFEVSTNGGSTWEPQCGKYTNPGSSNPGQPTGEPLYDGTQNSWVQEEIDLSDYLGESILVRFQLVSDNAQRRDGFYFDDLVINIVEDGVLSTEDALVDQLAIYPNPVRNTLNITTPLTNYGVEIYSLQGQSLFRSNSNSGSITVDYSSFSAGIYLMRITSENGSRTVKIVKQ